VNTQFKRQQLLIYLRFFGQKGGRQERLTWSQNQTFPG
jgi:hypothetical protein